MSSEVLTFSSVLAHLKGSQPVLHLECMQNCKAHILLPILQRSTF